MDLTDALVSDQDQAVLQEQVSSRGGAFKISSLLLRRVPIHLAKRPNFNNQYAKCGHVSTRRLKRDALAYR